METSSTCSSSSTQPDSGTQVGEVLTGHSRHYQIERLLHRGSFSKVATCRIPETNNVVAVKMVRNDKTKVGRREAEVLDQIRQLDPDRNNLLMFTEHLMHRNHCCLFFELLDMSLFKFMERRDFEPLHICEIRPIAQQMLVALKALKSIGLAHADIKPENIMLVNHRAQPFKVKLIGFGRATEASSLREENIVLNYAYRPPEVLLDHPSLDEGVDMWSLGCVLAFLLLGEDLYPFDCEYEAVRMIVELNCEMPNRFFLDAARRTARFFDRVEDVPRYGWWLKSPEQYTLETGNTIMDHCGFSKDFVSMEGLVMNKIKPRDGALQQDARVFINLLKQMLEVNPGSRITPNEALDHNFITMRHLPLRSQHHHVTSALTLMSVALGRDRQHFY